MWRYTLKVVRHVQSQQHGGNVPQTRWRACMRVRVAPLRPSLAPAPSREGAAAPAVSRGGVTPTGRVKCTGMAANKKVRHSLKNPHTVTLKNCHSKKGNLSLGQRLVQEPMRAKIAIQQVCTGRLLL